jgi:hypothetical protein
MKLLITFLLIASALGALAVAFVYFGVFNIAADGTRAVNRDQIFSWPTGRNLSGM